MNGFIGALAAQLALKPVSPAADGIAPRPRRPVAECLRAQRTARAKLAVPPRCSAYLQQLGASGGRTVRRCVCAPELQPHARARAVTTLRRVASQQPMAPALQVGRASMRLAPSGWRAPMPPGRRRASMPLPRPPSRPHADAPALSSRRCPPPQLGTAASRG